jgi:hypothetical protein
MILTFLQVMIKQLTIPEVTSEVTSEAISYKGGASLRDCLAHFCGQGLDVNFQVESHIWTVYSTSDLLIIHSGFVSYS